MDADLIVVGAGIVGLSTAMQLSERHPHLSILVVEKERTIAAHQTGHNSGVIHAGVYYAPNSLKARFCKEGAKATYAFSHRHGLPTERCGKLIVATNDVEMQRLSELYGRCQQNGLAPRFVEGAELSRIEPNIVGRAAILVTSSGIADYPAIARTMARIIEDRGGQILLGQAVTALREESDCVIVEAGGRVLRARHAVVCGGLMADRLARMCGIDVDFRIVPFRGEYFRLSAANNDIVKHLIYPVPDPSLPFLGVHLTRMIGGYVTVGPNAVLALAREGYSWRDVSVGDLADMATFGGFWKLIGHNLGSAAREFHNSIFRKGYLAECQKYCPGLSLADLEPYPAGVRAQAVLADGSMVHDFLVRRGRRTLHVCNAPSPAATAALPIGAHLVSQCEEAFGLQAASAPASISKEQNRPG